MKILDLHGEGGWRNGYREQVLDGQIKRQRERRRHRGKPRVTGKDEGE